MSWLDPFLLPVHHLIDGTAQWLPMPLVIVLLTVLVRLVLHPLNRATYRATLHRQRIAPQLQEVRARHGKDRERLQRELLELHQREGVSPVAGCLPALVQLPVFFVVYRLFAAPEFAGQVNSVLEHTMLGVPMTAHLVTAGPGLPVFVGLLTVSLVVAFLTMRQTRAYLVEPAAGGDPRQAEVAATMNRIMPWLSFGSVFAVAVLPLGTGIYLVTSALWTLVERAAVRRMVSL
ncbi:YidC/Oxa1 family membrane protein insertase [Ornithinimicrobium sp. F0845]|uniref:YidC/Oxa1 family membrane protein insertase n=1 Tax=Ornithinimicrobium sp. F0845 TaxID=2926412 RepID=UPI001FF3DAC1|nr:YidC/Oxa1 family membrane protein insertase [Ornithinimicrobium sp. F0845]MCK0110801.1 YidC/Oxa1 family membrane protein insertase [Ornithinimicrobium sp. F0845]